MSELANGAPIEPTTEGVNFQDECPHTHQEREKRAFGKITCLDCGKVLQEGIPS